MDSTKTEIVKLRAQRLLAQTTAIRGIAAVAAGEPDADKRGVTSTRVAALSAAITSFAAQVSAPCGQRLLLSFSVPFWRVFWGGLNINHPLKALSTFSKKDPQCMA